MKMNAIYLSGVSYMYLAVYLSIFDAVGVISFELYFCNASGWKMLAREGTIAWYSCHRTDMHYHNTCSVMQDTNI